MITYLWEALPAPTWAKVVLALFVFLAASFVMLEWVMPAIAPHIPWVGLDSSVDAPAA